MSEKKFVNEISYRKLVFMSEVVDGKTFYRNLLIKESEMVFLLSKKTT